MNINKAFEHLLNSFDLSSLHIEEHKKNHDSTSISFIATEQQGSYSLGNQIIFRSVIDNKVSISLKNKQYLIMDYKDIEPTISKLSNIINKSQKHNNSFIISFGEESYNQKQNEIINILKNGELISKIEEDKNQKGKYLITVPDNQTKTNQILIFPNLNTEENCLYMRPFEFLFIAQQKYDNKLISASISINIPEGDFYKYPLIQKMQEKLFTDKSQKLNHEDEFIDEMLNLPIYQKPLQPLVEHDRYQEVFNDPTASKNKLKI